MDGFTDVRKKSIVVPVFVIQKHSVHYGHLTSWNVRLDQLNKTIKKREPTK